MTAFISTSDLSDYLGRDVDADPAGTAAVEFACDVVRDFAEQTFTAGTSTVTLDGTGTDALLLPQVPVTAAGTVSVRDTDGAFQTAGTADYALNGDGVLYATDTAGTSTFGRTWPKERQNIRVTYNHGYASGQIPQSVVGVALTVAARMLVQGPALFESLGDLNVRYAAESTALMPTERLVLTKYRRHHNGT